MRRLAVSSAAACCCCCCAVTAVNCGPLPVVTTAHVTSLGATVYGSHAIYECNNHDSWFGRGIFIKISTCTEYGTWDLSEASCTRKLVDMHSRLNV